MLVLYFLGRELVRDERESSSSQESDNQSPARRVVFWATMLFAASPLGVHSVSWISGRKDLQCTFFGCLAVLALLRLGRKFSLRWLMCCWVSFALALGFKELAAVIPGIALVGLAKKTKIRQWRYRHIAALTGLWLILGGYLWLRRTVLGGIGLDMGNNPASWTSQISNAMRLFAHYVHTSILPYPTVLSDRWDSTARWGAAEILGGLLVLSIIAIAASAKRSQIRELTFMGLAWFTVWLAPALGFIPLRHARAERYLYPASWGLVLCFVALIIIIADRVGSRLPRRVQASVARFSGPDVATGSQPGAALGNIVLALISLTFVGLTNLEDQNWENDERLFATATDRDPQYVEGLIGLSHHYLRTNRFAEALTTLDQAFEAADANPESYWSPYIAYINRATALRSLGRHADAKADFLSARKFQPGLSAPTFGAGLSALDSGEYDEAEYYFLETLKITPNDRQAIGNLALVLLHKNQSRVAVRLLRPLMQSGDLDLMNKRTYGTALILQRKFRTATRVFEQTLADEPTNATDMAKLAWALWGSYRLQKAREVLARASELQPQNKTVLYVKQLMDQ